MKMMRILTPVLAPLALAVSAGASAGDSGYVPMPPPAPKNTVILRVGASYFHPNAEQMTFTDDSLQFFDSFRTTVDPSDEWGWNISGVWKPADHWGLELSYADGTDHTGGNSVGFLSIADLDFVPRNLVNFDAERSSATVNWYPLEPDCLFQPYIGVGINYTDFSSEKFNGVARRDLRDVGIRSSLSMGNSWGYSWQVGADIYLGQNSNWLVNVAAIYDDSETDVGFELIEDGSVNLNGFRESYSGDYLYNPWVFNLGIGYKFDL